jgi:phosphoglycolate phosphatase-like HAD superfamily hydrolase
MTKQQLSRQFFIAMEMIHHSTTNLFEQLHDQQGNPLQNKEQVERLLQKYQAAIKEELSGVREAIKEYHKE